MVPTDLFKNATKNSGSFADIYSELLSLRWVIYQLHLHIEGRHEGTHIS